MNSYLLGNYGDVFKLAHFVSERMQVVRFQPFLCCTLTVFKSSVSFVRCYCSVNMIRRDQSNIWKINPVSVKFFKGLLVLEMAAFGGVYLLYKKMDSSQDFRSTMKRRLPSVLEGFIRHIC
ncbi:protein CEBPZOS isoform X2 [Hyperolius riggenbachi]|uniref:protein CEBPZOS isoform X2 n=1 Tax=Hyperolius riggenbachi TaxID=752182 RepID=UPI0035A34E59